MTHQNLFMWFSNNSDLFRVTLVIYYVSAHSLWRLTMDPPVGGKKGGCLSMKQKRGLSLSGLAFQIIRGLIASSLVMSLESHLLSDFGILGDIICISLQLNCKLFSHWMLSYLLYFSESEVDTDEETVRIALHISKKSRSWWHSFVVKRTLDDFGWVFATSPTDKYNCLVCYF